MNTTVVCFYCRIPVELCISMASAAASEKTLKTRSAADIWLIGQQLPSAICELVLTAARQDCWSCLASFILWLKGSEVFLPEGCSDAIDEFFSIWYIAHIPTTRKPNTVARLKVLHARHVKLGKNKGRRTDRKMKLEFEFGKLMNKLFDVAQCQL